MTRRNFCSFLGMSLTFPVLPSFPRNLAAAQEESYRIYSLLMPALAQPKKAFLICDTTAAPEYPPIAVKTPPASLASMTHPMYIVVPENREAQFQEIVAEYERLKTVRIPLESKFQLPKPYELLDERQQREYEDLEPPHVGDPAHPWHENRSVARRYKDKGPLLQLSNVFFDSSNTLAAVYAVTLLNFRLRSWYVFESRNGLWSKLPWRIGAFSTGA